MELEQSFPTGEFLMQKVREFRQALGDTQQQFASRLGLAISTVVKYESTRAPKAEALTLLTRVALENDQQEFAQIFRRAQLNENFGSAVPLTIEEGGLVSVCLDLVRNTHLPEVDEAFDDVRLEFERAYEKLAKAAVERKKILGVSPETVADNQKALRFLNHRVRVNRMHRAGESVDEIAKQLDLSVERVRYFVERPN